MSARGNRTPLTRSILAVLKAIPRGKVAAYGQVAALAGHPRGARQVARVLHSGASGRISLAAEAGGEEQARRLRREGVPVDPSGRVDVAGYGWRPGIDYY
jgi:methylated-DNA-protein-cysteine methyltransferase-like protein